MIAKTPDLSRTEAKWIRRFIFAAMLLLQIIMHLNCDTLFADDGVFYTALDAGGSLSAFLLKRWNRWSSRLLIEAVLAVTTHSIWLWRILDSLVMTGIAYALFRLSDEEKRPETAILSCLMVLSIPFRLIRTTGWQATSVNYTWPMCAVFLCLIPSVDAIRRKKPMRVMRILSIPGAVFGANQEQMAVLLFLMALFFLVSESRCRKRWDYFTFAILLIAAGEIVMHLLCPGNALRSAASEKMVNLRDYRRFTLPDRLSIGLSSTVRLLFYTKNYPFWICLTLIAGSTFSMGRRPFLIPVSLVAPLACYLGRHWKQYAGLTWLARFSAYDLQTGPARILEDGQLAGLFFWILALFCIALSLYIVLGEQERTAASIWCFASGFAARMVLSFSPTVVESGERTILPLYACLMLAVLLCVTAAPKNRKCFFLLPGFLLALYAAWINFFGSFALAM